MGNPDLELHNPAPDPRHRRRRQDLGTACTVAAIAVIILVTIGFWTVIADGAIIPFLHGLLFTSIGGTTNSHEFAAGHLLHTAGGGSGDDDQEKAYRCAIDNLHRNTSFLQGVQGISTQEFLQRRDILAKVLSDEGVDAFIVEPGFTFEYYANVSQHDWEPYEPEDRPFLMIIQPVEDAATGTVTARTAFLAPHFEVGRARMLAIPRRAGEAELDIVVWEEHLDPYETLRASRLFSPPAPTKKEDSDDDDDDDNGNPQPPVVMADPETRSFIVSGLWSAGFALRPASAAAQRIPQVKSPGQVAILRAVNTAALAVVRAVRPCLVPGLTERQVSAVARRALASLDGGGRVAPLMDIVLFDAHGALPHGGMQTGDGVLTYTSVVTMELGAHYLGHSSDVARSFSIPQRPNNLVGRGQDRGDGGGDGGDGNKKKKKKKKKIPKDPLEPEKQLVFQTVLQAQAAAADAMRASSSSDEGDGTTAAAVDMAARRVIEHAGYGYAFPHRLGHGIGVRVREAPYLNKFNKEERLLPGMVFVDEPGVYLEQRFGIRLADVYLVRGDGEPPELLTDRLAMGLDDP